MGAVDDKHTYGCSYCQAFFFSTNLYQQRKLRFFFGWVCLVKDIKQNKSFSHEPNNKTKELVAPTSTLIRKISRKHFSFHICEFNMHSSVRTIHRVYSPFAVNQSSWSRNELCNTDVVIVDWVIGLIHEYCSHSGNSSFLFSSENKKIYFLKIS